MRSDIVNAEGQVSSYAGSNGLMWSSLLGEDKDIVTAGALFFGYAGNMWFINPFSNNYTYYGMPLRCLVR